MPVITNFYIHRIPLVIMITGCEGCGKTIMAFNLSNKLHCHSIINMSTLLDIVTATECANVDE